MDAKQVAEVKQALESKDFDNNIFNESSEKILDLIFNDSFPRFIRSTEFEQYKVSVEDAGKKKKRKGLSKLASGVIQRKLFKGSDSTPEVVEQNAAAKKNTPLARSANLPITKKEEELVNKSKRATKRNSTSRKEEKPNTPKKSGQKASSPTPSREEKPKKNSSPTKEEVKKKKENFLAKKGALKSESSASNLADFVETRERRSSSLTYDNNEQVTQ